MIAAEASTLLTASAHCQASAEPPASPGMRTLRLRPCWLILEGIEVCAARRGRFGSCGLDDRAAVAFLPRPGRKMGPVMSVQPRPWPQPAPEIAAAVAVMYKGKRERPLPVMVRDQLGEWLADEQFAGAYGKRGKPGWPPGLGDGFPDGGGPDRPAGRRGGPHRDRLEILTRP